jgi:rubrerythrin
MQINTPNFKILMNKWFFEAYDMCKWVRKIYWFFTFRCTKCGTPRIVGEEQFFCPNCDKDTEQFL